MVDFKPQTQSVPVRMRIPGQPETVHVAGEMQPRSLPETFVNSGADLPKFDRYEHDRLLNTHMFGGMPHYQQPQHMTARQILETHNLTDEWGTGRTRKEVIERKLNDLQDPDARIRGFYGTDVEGATRESKANSALGSATSFGGGLGHGVVEGLTNRGWDWDKPIPLGMDGSFPVVRNGQHRLAYMWMHHPDVPIPVEMDNTSNNFINYAHRDKLMDALNNPTSKNMANVTAFEKNASKEKRDKWFAKMASIGLPKRRTE